MDFDFGSSVLKIPNAYWLILTCLVWRAVTADSTDCITLAEVGKLSNREIVDTCYSVSMKASNWATRISRDGLLMVQHLSSVRNFLPYFAA